jgi:hypothetical protein
VQHESLAARASYAGRQPRKPIAHLRGARARIAVSAGLEQPLPQALARLRDGELEQFAWVPIAIDLQRDFRAHGAGKQLVE